jgi:hypothetical protein
MAFTSTITTPDMGQIGNVSSEVRAGILRQTGQHDAYMASAISDLASQAKADVETLGASVDTLTGGTAAGVGATRLVRGVVTSNVADLAAFTVANNDGLTYAANNIVFLAKQTTGSQSGPYVVGTVAGGTAPLTRPTWWAAASVQPAGTKFRAWDVSATTWGGSEWFATASGNITVGTTDPVFYPAEVKATSAALSGSGTADISNTWILSATKSEVLLSHAVAGGTMGHLTHGTLTAGQGTGSFTITSSSATDTSTVTYLIKN